MPGVGRSRGLLFIEEHDFFTLGSGQGLLLNGMFGVSNEEWTDTATVVFG